MIVLIVENQVLFCTNHLTVAWNNEVYPFTIKGVSSHKTLDIQYLKTIINIWAAKAWFMVPVMGVVYKIHCTKMIVYSI